MVRLKAWFMRFLGIDTATRDERLAELQVELAEMIGKSKGKIMAEKPKRLVVLNMKTKDGRMPVLLHPQSVKVDEVITFTTEVK